MKKEDSASEVAELGRKLKEARKRQGMSLPTVAKLAEITPSFLSKIEKGSSCPSSINLARLAKVLGEDLDSLLNHILTFEEKFDAKCSSLSEEEKRNIKVWGTHPFNVDFETKKVLLRIIEDILAQRDKGLKVSLHNGNEKNGN